MWEAFVSVLNNFLENDKAENYKGVVETMLLTLKLSSFGLQHEHKGGFPQQLFRRISC